jgi:hypothetical protein
MRQLTVIQRKRFLGRNQARRQPGSAHGSDRHERLPAASMFEPSSLWPFAAIVLGGVGCYTALGIHLVLDATNASAWGLAWMAVPTVFLCASGGALLIGSGMPVRERFAAIPAAILGYSPRGGPGRSTTPTQVR